MRRLEWKRHLYQRGGNKGAHKRMWLPETSSRQQRYLFTYDKRQGKEKGTGAQ